MVLIAWLLPTPIQAKEEPLVFSKIEPKTLVIYKPYPSDFQTPKPRQVVEKPRIKNSTPVPKIQKVSVSSTGRYNPCSCVSFVKSQTGYSQSVGNAKNWPVNSKVPVPNSVIVTYESSAGHVAIVSHSDDQYVYIKAEANYSRCKVTGLRKLPLNSKVIKGFWIN